MLFSQAVVDHYQTWAYPRPLFNSPAAWTDGFDPSHARGKLWPNAVEPDDLDILIAGCGTNQAAYYAAHNPHCRVVGLDVSDAAIQHETYLKNEYSLENLDLFLMDLGDIRQIGRQFHLIVCTGVLHHLPDPTAGLKSLRGVLRPHGVIGVMVYAHYPRLGVYMVQEALRILGEEGIDSVKLLLSSVPQWHHVLNYLRFATDLNYDAGLADTFLHPLDRAFTVPQIMEIAGQSGLEFQSWLDEREYRISSYITDPQDPLRKRIEALPPTEQWRAVEMIMQLPAVHCFVLRHDGGAM